jgi:hypothetical protein
MNSEVSKLTGLKPVDGIMRESIVITLNQNQQKINPDISLLSKQVRYLYQPGEVENDAKTRATDPLWSIHIYEVERAVSTLPPTYYLRQPAPKRAFVKEELQIVPPDTVSCIVISLLLLTLFIF